MTVSGGEGQPGVGELGRQLQVVLNRFETLANGLEQKFVNKEVNKVDRELINETIRGMREAHTSLRRVVEQHEDRHATKSEVSEVKKDLASLSEEIKDGKRWIVRLVIGALIIAAVGFIVAGGISTGGGGG